VAETRSPLSAAEARILDAAKSCCEQWGFERVTVDDIAAAAKVSRATLYRLFPGGKDVLFEALRVQELEDFFNRLLAAIGETDEFEELLVRAVVFSMQDMRSDQHLAIMMSTAPGETLDQLTVHGVPRIIRVASTFLTPLVQPFLGYRAASEVVELLVRLVISGFLAPSERIDFTKPDDVRQFIRKIILPAYSDALAVAAGGGSPDN
jgi:AcrR family transcriptional regulator